MQCELCKKECNGLKGLSVHLNMMHSYITKKEYTLKYFYDGINPVCKCGCSQKTNFKKIGKFREFINGHNGIGKNNGFYKKGHSPKTIEKILNSEGYKNRKIKPRIRIYNKCLWCLSLIETIPSINKKFCNRNCYALYKSNSIKNKTPDGLKYWKQCVNGGLNGYIHPYKENKLEKRVESILNDNNIKFEKQKKIKNDILNKRIDFFISNKNIILQIDGDYWHCNPNKYKSNYFHTKRKLEAKEIWRKDNQETNSLEKCGYIVKRIWETDVNRLNILKILKN